MERDYVPNFDQCRLPYVQWYQDDFIGGVRGMKAQEIGIYTMLLMEMYARGRALDQPHDRLARMCGADKRTFERALAQLIDDGKIVRLECGYWNERCENAFRSRAKMQQQNSEAAARGWENRKENNGAGLQTHSARIADAMPNSEAQKEEDKSSSYTRKRASPEKVKNDPIETEFFGTFWPVYPKAVGRKTALQAFRKARMKTDIGTIMGALHAYCRETQTTDRQFIKHPTTWLNAESWEDAQPMLAAPVPVSVEKWAKRLNSGRTHRKWPVAEWGPLPGQPGCHVPQSLIEPGDGEGWSVMERAA